MPNGEDDDRESPSRPQEDSRATLRADDYYEDEESIVGNSTFGWGDIGRSAARRQLQRLNLRGGAGRWRREGTVGDRVDNAFSPTASLLRAIQFALILTAIIPIVIVLRYTDKPRSELASAVDYKKLERVDVSKLKNAAPWDNGGDEVEGYNVLLEMHTHTTHSDGQLTPEQVVDWAYAYGFTAVVVSDHQTLSGGLAAKAYAERTYNNTILVIPALEYTTCRIHMSLIGLPPNTTSKHLLPDPIAWPTDEDLAKLIAKTHSLGGIAVANHLPWSLKTEWNYHVPTLQHHPSREQLLEWGIDAFEILHGTTLDLPTLYFARKHGLPLISSTDLHSPTEIPHGWTTLHVPTIPPTQDDILSQLRKGKSNFIFDPTDEGRETIYAPENPKYDKWRIVTALDFPRIFYEEEKGMYSFTGKFCHQRKFRLRWRAIVWFVLWVVMGWGIYEIVRWGLVMAWRHLKGGMAGGRIRL